MCASFDCHYKYATLLPSLHYTCTFRVTLYSLNVLKGMMQTSPGCMCAFTNVCLASILCVLSPPFPCSTCMLQILDDPDYSLVKALQTAQQNFVITDASLPDNPIVFASGGFLAVRRKVTLKRKKYK